MTAKQEAVAQAMGANPQREDECTTDWTKRLAPIAGVSAAYIGYILRMEKYSQIGAEIRARDAKPKLPPSIHLVPYPEEKPAPPPPALSAEMAPPRTITVPSRWRLGKPLKGEQAVTELKTLGEIIRKGTDMLTGVYMRVTDTIRASDLSDQAVREALDGVFNKQRISEILRVARAPEEVYTRYTAGFFGFRSALKQTRYFNITPSPALKAAQMRRAAERLIDLIGQNSLEMELLGCRVTVQRIEPGRLVIPTSVEEIHQLQAQDGRTSQ